MRPLRHRLQQVVVTGCLLWAAPCLSAETDANVCRPKETRVVVLTEPHVLVLCADGVETKRWKVALGSGGVDKRVQGDAKTPLGEYGLGAPRPSAQFHTFIPVAYPTAAQKKAGFTGTAVGVHGPPRGFAHAGLLTVQTDWTLGCIALPSDEDIDTVAAFVRSHKAALRVEGLPSHG